MPSIIDATSKTRRLLNGSVLATGLVVKIYRKTNGKKDLNISELAAVSPRPGLSQQKFNTGLSKRFPFSHTDFKKFGFVWCVEPNTQRKHLEQKHAA